jgi:hypothetical protein
MVSSSTVMFFNGSDVSLIRICKCSFKLEQKSHMETNVGNVMHVAEQ